jgi:hypothetical protein
MKAQTIRQLIAKSEVAIAASSTEYWSETALDLFDAITSSGIIEYACEANPQCVKMFLEDMLEQERDN